MPATRASLPRVSLFFSFLFCCCGHWQYKWSKQGALKQSIFLDVYGLIPLSARSWSLAQNYFKSFKKVWEVFLRLNLEPLVVHIYIYIGGGFSIEFIYSCYPVFTYLATLLHLAMRQWLRAQTLAPSIPFPLWPLGHKKSRSLSGLPPPFNISRFSLMSTSKNCLYFACTTDI